MSLRKRPQGSTPREAAAAHELLSQALADLADRGTVPPCATDPERWCGEDHDEHLEAAALCQGCPVFDACAVASAGESHGVWAGRCLSKTHGRTPQRKDTAA